MSGISKQERLRRTAYHEAGHAIVAFGVDRAFKEVTIIPSEGYLGVLKHRPWITFDPTMTSSGWEDRETSRIKLRIMLCLGGPAAESILLGRSVMKYRWGWADHGIVLDLLDALYAGLGLDAEVDKEVGKYIEYMELVVKNFLRVNWKFVERVAQALLLEKTLTYKKAKELVYRDLDLSWEEQDASELPITPMRLKYL